MNKKTLIELKEELKLMAKEIKTAKPEFKNQQRYISLNDIDYRDSANAKQFFIKHWNLISKIYYLKREFRHKHIAYCLLKGTPYESVENPSENNKPNWDWIGRIKNGYDS